MTIQRRITSLAAKAVSGVVIDTAYLSPKDWNKWSDKLKLLEKELGLKRLRVEINDATQWGSDIKEYKIVYENPGIKAKREAYNAIRRLWDTFPNKLSRRMC
jgi:hypothetical protein